MKSIREKYVRKGIIKGVQGVPSEETRYIKLKQDTEEDYCNFSTDNIDKWMEKPDTTNG